MTISGRGATALVVALVISVLVNLVAAGFAGVVLGGTLVGGAILRQATAPMPPELRQAIRSELFANRRPLRAALVGLRDDRDALHAALTAETLDQAAVDAANARIRADVDALLALAQGLLVEAVAGLPDDVRRNLPPLNFRNQFLQSLPEPDRSELETILPRAG